MDSIRDGIDKALIRIWSKVERNIRSRTLFLAKNRKGRTFQFGRDGQRAGAPAEDVILSFDFVIPKFCSKRFAHRFGCADQHHSTLSQAAFDNSEVKCVRELLNKLN